jgi:hypothetical protein
MPVLNYFDLNNRWLKGKRLLNLRAGILGAKKKNTSLVGVEIQNEKKPVKIISDTPNVLSPLRQILMYLGIFIGVLFSSWVDQFKHGGDVNIKFTVGRIIISSIIALVIVPIAYEKLNVSPRAPFIVQFGIFVQNGIFWQVLIKAVS